MIKKILIATVAALLLVAAWPTLFNVLLIARYELGNEYMARRSGERGQLSGEWTVTFDTITCGFDSRNEWRLVMDPEDTGRLYTESYWDKYRYRHGSSVATLASLLPYDKSNAVRDTCAVRRVDHNLVVTGCLYDEQIVVDDTVAVLSSLGPDYTVDDLPYLGAMILHHEVRGNRLYVGEVMRIGESTERFGFYHSPPIRLRDALAWW